MTTENIPERSWCYHPVLPYIKRRQKNFRIIGVIRSLRQKIEGDAATFGEKKVLFHHNNAPAHSFGVDVAKLHELRYELLSNLPYLPDLAP